MTPEEAIQQSLQTVAGMHQQFDAPPMADMPEGESAPAGYAAPPPNMMNQLPIGSSGDMQGQILDVLKTLLERVGTLAIAAERFTSPQVTASPQNSPQVPTGPQPTPAEREQGVEDFKNLTGKDVQKVADPMAAIKTITQDRQEEAKQELDEKLQKGVITEKQHKEQLARSNKQIERKTWDQAERGVLDQEIQQAQKDAVNNEIDQAANKKGTPDTKVDAIKQNLGVAKPEQPAQQQGGGGDTAKLIKQVGDQQAALLQKLLQEKKATDDELNKQSQMLQQIQQNLQTLMDQAEGQRQRNQRAGGSR